MKITVAICTWNRSALLDMTLTEMGKLRIPPGLQWELLVVNNRCTDETDEVIAKHAGHLPLRRLYEDKQGLSNARNCAVAATTGELLVWTDDDVMVDPHWLEEYARAADRWPEAGYFGGTVDPLFEAPPPSWVAENLPLLEGVFALRQLGPQVRPLHGDELPFGANMAFRRDCIASFLFDTKLGRLGAATLSGEETELIERLQKKGVQGIWVGSAAVRHWVQKERMTYEYVWKWFYGAGICSARADNLFRPRAFGVPRWVVRRYIEGVSSWLFGCLLGSTSRRVSGMCRWALNAGMIAEYRRLCTSGDGSEH